MRERRMMAVSRDVRHGERLHRMLVAELSGAGCFRPAAARTAAYGAFILASYAAAYAALLTGPGVAARALAIFVLAFISVPAGLPHALPRASGNRPARRRPPARHSPAHARPHPGLSARPRRPPHRPPGGRRPRHGV